MSCQIVRQPKPRCNVTTLYADEPKAYVRLPGGSANLISSSRCLGSPDSYWERLVHLQAHRRCPSYLSIGCTGNTGPPRGPRWSRALVVPAGREHGGHWSRGRPCVSAHIATSVVKPRKPQNKFPPPRDAALSIPCSCLLLGSFLSLCL